MWNERVDIIRLLRNSHRRIAISRILAKQLADATAQTEALIFASQEAIFDCDQFIRQNPNYTAPAYPFPKTPESD